MLIIGLTGGIASGKSTVSTQLSTKHSLPLIDLDILSRQVVQPHSRALTKLVHHFGPQILLQDGSLNRQLLGDLIFNDPEKRKTLNGILHPAIRWEMVKLLVGYWVKGQKMVVVDAPLLVEAGLWRFCGAIVVVYCSEQLQLQRLLRRSETTDEDARARIASQAPLSSKLAYADYVIDNSGSVQELSAQVDRVVRKLEHTAGWTWVISWLLPPLGVIRGLWTIFYRLYFKKVGQERKRKRRVVRRKQQEEQDEEIELTDISGQDIRTGM